MKSCNLSADLKVPLCTFSDNDDELAVHELLNADNDCLKYFFQLYYEYVRELLHCRAGRRVLTWLHKKCHDNTTQTTEALTKY